MVASQVSALTKIIIGIAVFLIILAPLTLLGGEKGEQNSLVQKCKLEVAKASKLTLLDRSTRKKLGTQLWANCPRVELGKLDLPDDEAQAERRLAKILVDEYYDCWDKFGKGILNPYPGGKSFQDKRCYICSTFTSPGDYDLEDGMDTYLETFPDKLEFFVSGLFIDSADDKNVYSDKNDNDVYYSISELDFKDDEFEFDDIEKRDLTFKEDEVYHLVNILVADAEGRGWGLGLFFGLNTYDTISKMAIIRDEDLDKTCKFIEN